MTTETFDPNAPIYFTQKAADRAKYLIEDEGNYNLKLRLFVTGGGCSGFQYGFSFDETLNEDDITLTKNNVTLAVDALSIQYLMGAEVDYEEGLAGSRFIVNNPTASSTCSCGASFTL